MPSYLSRSTHIYKRAQHESTGVGALAGSGRSEAQRNDALSSHLVEWSSALQSALSTLTLARRRALLPRHADRHLSAAHVVPLRQRLRQCEEHSAERAAHSAEQTKQLVQQARSAGIEHATHESLQENAQHTMQALALLRCSVDLAADAAQQ